jgi:hypothetical protein
MFDDPFRQAMDSPMTPAENCFTITPSDSAELPCATKAIYIGEGGDVALIPVRGKKAVTFRNLPSGAILDVRVRAIRATGTTARELVGLA